ncbi:MAG: inositol oxygenase family protein [Acidimicrobiia bacterium]
MERASRTRNWRRLARVGAAAVGNLGHDARTAVQFAGRALSIDRRRQRQTVAAVESLAQRGTTPIATDVYVWDLVQRLGTCVDPTDARLRGASQLLHVAQIVEHMERTGEATDDLLLVAFVHDLGKLALGAGWDPAAIVGSTRPLTALEPGIGLDHVTFQFGHGHYAARRFEGLLPEHLVWVVRHHGIDVAECRVAMSPRDLEWTDRYLLPFQRHDRGAKSSIRVPAADLERYRDLIEKQFPEAIDF